MHSLQTRRWLGICPRGGLRWLRGAYYTPWQWWKACARRCPGNANAQTWSLSASFFQRSPAAPLLIFYPPQNFSPQTCSFCLHCTISIPLGARLHPCTMWDNLLISNTDFWWWRSFLDSQLGGKILCHFIENIKMQGFNLWAKNSWLNRCRWGRKRRSYEERNTWSQKARLQNFIRFGTRRLSFNSFIDLYFVCVWRGWCVCNLWEGWKTIGDRCDPHPGRQPLLLEPPYIGTVITVPPLQAAATTVIWLPNSTYLHFGFLIVDNIQVQKI